jgi:hypothetical protein
VYNLAFVEKSMTNFSHQRKFILESSFEIRNCYFEPGLPPEDSIDSYFATLLQDTTVPYVLHQLEQIRAELTKRTLQQNLFLLQHVYTVTASVV